MVPGSKIKLHHILRTPALVVSNKCVEWVDSRIKGRKEEGGSDPRRNCSSVSRNCIGWNQKRRWWEFVADSESFEFPFQVVGRFDDCRIVDVSPQCFVVEGGR